MKKFQRVLLFLIFLFLISCNGNVSINPGGNDKPNTPSNPSTGDENPSSPSEPSNPSNPGNAETPDTPTPTPTPDPEEPTPSPDPNPNPDPDEPSPSPTPDTPSEPDNPPSSEKIFNVDKTSLTFQGEGGSDTVTITSNYDEDVEISINDSWLESEKKDNLLTITASENTVWKRSSKITLSVSDKTLTINVSQNSNPNVEKRNVWLNGITEPKSGELEYTVPGGEGKYPQQNWPESATTEWFNVKKFSTGVGGDSNMCFAMTAANMSHWWFYKNPQFVENYIKTRKASDPSFDDTNYHPVYDKSKLLSDFMDEDGNLETKEWQEFEKNKSSFAKIVRDNFENSSGGGYASNVLNWLFLGLPYTSSDTKKPLNLFGDVISKDDEDVLVEPLPLNGQPMDFITTTLKTAIEKGEAIGITYKFKNGSRHAVNLYGIIEDKFGNLVGIWVDDNNLETDGLLSYGLNPTKDSTRELLYEITNLSNGNYGSSSVYADFAEITILHNKDV